MKPGLWTHIWGLMSASCPLGECSLIELQYSPVQGLTFAQSNLLFLVYVRLCPMSCLDLCWHPHTCRFSGYLLDIIKSSLCSFSSLWARLPLAFLFLPSFAFFMLSEYPPLCTYSVFVFHGHCPLCPHGFSCLVSHLCQSLPHPYSISSCPRPVTDTAPETAGFVSNIPRILCIS